MRIFFSSILFLPRKFQFKQNVNGFKENWHHDLELEHKTKAHTHIIREITAPNSHREIYIFISTIDIAIFHFPNFQFSVDRFENKPPFYRIVVSQPHFVMHCVVYMAIAYNKIYRLVRGMCIDRRCTCTSKQASILHYTQEKLYIQYIQQCTIISLDCRCSLQYQYSSNILQFLKYKMFRKFRWLSNENKRKQKGKCFSEIETKRFGKEWVFIWFSCTAWFRVELVILHGSLHVCVSVCVHVHGKVSIKCKGTNINGIMLISNI